jgi:hypothetical protein
MYLAAHERLFLFDFWSQGVLYANAACENLTDAAKAIHFWIAETPTIADMEKRFSFFRPTDEGKAHEAGQAVEYEWESLLNRLTELEEDMSDESISLRPLIEAARRRPELRQLFPYMSLDRLCFSRTTGYPFTSDCPRAVAMENGRYRVYSAKPRFEKRRYGGGEYEEAVYEVIGEGNVEEVINMLVANLPPNCGAAVSGTAEDLNRTTEEELEN